MTHRGIVPLPGRSSRKAEARFEVDVNRRQDSGVMAMAGGHQAVAELPLLMVVNQGEAGDRLSSAPLSSCLRKKRLALVCS